MSKTRSSLLRRVQDTHDQPSWEEFDKLYRPLLIQYASSRNLTRDEAEEIAQQGMAAIAGGIQKFERRSSLRSWMRGIVDNKVKDHLRSHPRERSARTGDFQREQTTELNPATIWEREWNKTHLLYCLNLIKDDVSQLTFEAFQMYVIEECPVAQISAKLSMSANQIYVAKHRVMERLKKRWMECADGTL
ncbi:MAG: hypothetical protein DHS20C16_05040 [Phycisphaerae bacterium]|nr:MAG: hypothetical protein DHS20C16_05040 [Phycisphaerae bacterium]